MRRPCRLFVLFAAFLWAASGGVWAQTGGGGDSNQSEKSEKSEKPVDPLNRSLRMAALQLAAGSLSDSSGGIVSPAHLPQRVVVLPLHLERSAGGGKGGTLRLPMDEPVLRARFMEFLGSVRHGDAFVVVPLGAKDTARIVRLSPGGVAKSDKPDAKVLDAARKAKADCVLYGSLTPPTPGSREAVWLLNWVLLSVGSEKKDSTVVKSGVLTTLRFDGGRL